MLTKEVEDYRQQRLQSRLDALHVHDRRRESYRAVKDGAPGAWVTAWPGAGCRLSPMLASPTKKKNQRQGVKVESR